jgi:predicted  nucleic acid-binding Zn-ribbon protein
MPCDAIQLADEVEYLRSRFTASQEEMTELLTEHRKQGKELERLRQERRDNFDEIRERF